MAGSEMARAVRTSPRREVFGSCPARPGRRIKTHRSQSHHVAHVPFSRPLSVRIETHPHTHLRNGWLACSVRFKRSDTTFDTTRGLRRESNLRKSLKKWCPGQDSNLGPID